jgi:hypothetical protein
LLGGATWWDMTDAGDGRTTPQPGPATQAGPGWYPDFWTPSRRRYWTGSSWTFATTDSAQLEDPPPADASPLPDGHRLPPPVDPRQTPTAPAGTGGPPAKPPQKKWKWALAVVVGLLVGMAGVAMSNRSSSNSGESSSETGAGRAPTTNLGPSTSAPGSAAGNDPSATTLASLVVQPDDVPSTATVAVLPGGIGLGQPTLDLCNGTYPSESRRTARVQDAVLDAQGALVLSTEAVLYADSGGTTQALSELRSVVAACPPTPVPDPTGGPASTTTFNPAPDAGWSQTPSVNRVAYDLVTDDGSGRPPRHIVAVYLQRGRALLGVYFSRPEGPQMEVEGQTTIEGIVGVFAARLAALPTSVVGA